MTIGEHIRSLSSGDVVQREIWHYIRVSVEGGSYDLAFERLRECYLSHPRYKEYSKIIARTILLQ